MKRGKEFDSQPGNLKPVCPDEDLRRQQAKKLFELYHLGMEASWYRRIVPKELKDMFAAMVANYGYSPTKRKPDISSVTKKFHHLEKDKDQFKNEVIHYYVYDFPKKPPRSDIVGVCVTYSKEITIPSEPVWTPFARPEYSPEFLRLFQFGFSYRAVEGSEPTFSYFVGNSDDSFWTMKQKAEQPQVFSGQKERIDHYYGPKGFKLKTEMVWCPANLEEARRQLLFALNKKQHSVNILPAGFKEVSF